MINKITSCDLQPPLFSDNFIKFMTLSSDWDNEPYVELYLVQKVLNLVVPLDSYSSKWIPQFKIKIPHKKSSDKVDYFIEDSSKNIKFLVEVKTAKTRINNATARQQLDKYLRYSGVRFGILIDPFLVEIYHFKKGQTKLKSQFDIKDITDIKSIAEFIKTFFLESIKMRSIAIHNSKGGVGKTTLAINIAYELSKRGNKVLVVDLDDQANASLTIGVNKAKEINNASTPEEHKKIYKFLDERLEVINFIKFVNKAGEIEDYRNCIVSSKSIENLFGVDVLPASHKTTENELPSGPTVLRYLDMGLIKFVEDYQYVIFDTAPGSNALTWCGFYAAQYLVIPSQMEYLSVYGIRHVIRNAEEVQKDSNGQRSNILGIVPMMVDGKNLNKTVEEFVRDSFPDIPILPAIKRATGVGKASHENIPMSQFAEKDKESPKTSKEVAESLKTLTTRLVEKIEEFECKNG
ncbi:AAA family ATPase [Candidatus Parabeggiatoa sp. HSG14]|uniref:AAA family ATPase n=1 Tax=Candidatus Parabeggiatoa sp. HSG14 TaxID=3055593 RepID=UPI0025A7FE1B|nr:AAA family ATPase [Thiotrichales bacterium HSG14]